MLLGSGFTSPHLKYAEPPKHSRTKPGSAAKAVTRAKARDVRLFRAKNQWAKPELGIPMMCPGREARIVTNGANDEGRRQAPGLSEVKVNLHYADPPATKTSFETLVAKATAWGVLIALITGIMTVAFTVWPGWKPLGPPRKTGGIVAKVAVASSVTYRQYLAHTGRTGASTTPSGEAPTPPPPSQLGYEVSARVDLSGDESHVYTVIATVFDAKTLEAYSTAEDPTYRHETQVLQPSVRDFSAAFRCWISVNLPPGTYVFQAALYDGGEPPDTGQTKPGPGALIDFAYSEPYTVPAGSS